jgi:hypothetical protein
MAIPTKLPIAGKQENNVFQAIRELLRKSILVQNISHFVISGFLFRINAVPVIRFACNVWRSDLITEQSPTKRLFIRILL